MNKKERRSTEISVAPLAEIPAIPEELKKDDKFVGWKRESRGSKESKPPVNPHNGRNADVSDPSTWSDLATAESAVEKFDLVGLGRVLTADDSYCVIDIDGCRDPQTREIDHRAQRIVARLDSYTEISPSGTGVHVYTHAHLSGRGRRGKYDGLDVEVYDRARYITMTGVHLSSTPKTVEDRQQQVEELVDQMSKAKGQLKASSLNKARQVGSDQEVLDRARSAVNGSKFEALYEGEWKKLGYASQSEADLALCEMLMFHTQGDADHIDRLFRDSALYRSKWDKTHSSDGRTYGQMTIEKAAPAMVAGKERDVSDLKNWNCPPVQWLIDKILTRGILTLVAAPTQTGKTWLLLYLAWALVTVRQIFGKYKIAPAKGVFYLCLEDSESRIRDRLLEIEKELGTLDPDKFCISFVRGFSLLEESSFRYLETQIKKGFDVLIIDTYQRGTTGVESYNDAKHTPVLHRLADLTRSTGVSIIVVDHLRKSPPNSTRRSLSVDDIKGTGGKAQNADSIILLNRSSSDVTVRVLSKDAPTQTAFVLRVATPGSKPPKFQYIQDLSGSSSSAANAKLLRKQEILKAMSPGTRYSTTDLAKATGIPQPSVARYLKELYDGKKVKKKGAGRWTKYSL